MAEEKTFTIPLRRHFRIYPRWRRTKIAVRATRNFLLKHLKTEEVKLGKYLNVYLHEHGRKNPPAMVKVKAWREVWKADLIDAPIEKEQPEEKKGEKHTEEKKEGNQEKKEILEKPMLKDGKQEEKVEEKHVGDIQGKGAKEIAEKERKKRMFPKSQKPSHEKKKSNK